VELIPRDSRKLFVSDLKAAATALSALRSTETLPSSDFP
jgi:hypothetical protein